MKKIALITGITGQDGSYLAELLFREGYEVHGIIRRSSTINTERIDHLYEEITRHYGDLTDAGSIHSLVNKIQPDEIYNLGAQTHVRLSFDAPAYTMDVVNLGALNLLEAIRSINPKIKFYQASSSEIFGNSPAPQTENSKIDPISPYGIAKASAYHLTRMYREAYGIFACNGILFNHESPRRGETFVSRKIAKGVARIKLGLQHNLVLGNLMAFRDWGYAPDFVEGIYKIMQYKKADDFVLATGVSYSVRHFVDEAFACVGLEASKYVEFDEKFVRPLEVNHLRGNYHKANILLGWFPKVQFHELVKIMVDAELHKVHLTPGIVTA